MKFSKIKEKKWFNGAVIVCIGVAFFVFLMNFGKVMEVIGTILGHFRPVILGVIIAYVISPLAKLFFTVCSNGSDTGSCAGTFPFFSLLPCFCSH